MTKPDLSLRDRLEMILGPLRVLEPVSQNYGFYVHRTETAEARYAVKSGKGEMAAQLAVEARMLADLAETRALPLPAVIHAEDDLLILEWIETDAGGRAIGQVHERAAGEMLADLHRTRRPFFGYSYDTPIGGLRQPNPETGSWVAFFRDARMMHFGKLALDRGAISAALVVRLEALALRLAEILPEPPHPSLVHGDAWFGNILTRGDKIAGFIDPALHFASPEIELAYVTMHGTFGPAFFESYRANASIEPGFEGRIDVLNIVPNLVHVLLCGPSYITPIERALDRHGC